MLPKAEVPVLPFEPPPLRVVDQVSYESRYRCDGCLRSWREVRGGPMLTHDVWARICDQRPRDILCDPCIRDRFERVYRRPLRIDDLFPCQLNVICGHYQELAPALLLADWARYVVEERCVTATRHRRSGRTALWWVHTPMSRSDLLEGVSG